NQEENSTRARSKSPSESVGPFYQNQVQHSSEPDPNSIRTRRNSLSEPIRNPPSEPGPNSFRTRNKSPSEPDPNSIRTRRNSTSGPVRNCGDILCVCIIILCLCIIIVFITSVGNKMYKSVLVACRIVVAQTWPRVW
ncbi:hypothetical protein AMECASPLE_017632, partial [Ameca splendens]